MVQCGIGAKDKINLRDVNTLNFHESCGAGPL
jgi:hypothetical protein